MYGMAAAPVESVRNAHVLCIVHAHGSQCSLSLLCTRLHHSAVFVFSAQAALAVVGGGAKPGVV